MTKLPVTFERILKMPWPFHHRKYTHFNFNDVLVLVNHSQEEQEILLRIDGQKYDYIYLPGLGKKRYYLKEIPEDAHISIEKLLDPDSIAMLHYYEKPKE